MISIRYIFIPHGEIKSNLIAREIINRQHRPEVRFLLPRIQTISHSIHIRKVFPIRRCIFLPVKTSWLLIQEEYVAMRTTSWRWRRTNVVGDERLCDFQRQRSRTGGGSQTGLDPVENGTQDIEGWEGGVDVEGDDHIGFGRISGLEGKFGRRLSI